MVVEATLLSSREGEHHDSPASINTLSSPLDVRDIEGIYRDRLLILS